MSAKLWRNLLFTMVFSGAVSVVVACTPSQNKSDVVAVQAAPPLASASGSKDPESPQIEPYEPKTPSPDPTSTPTVVVAGALLQPSRATLKAPEQFKVRFQTSRGDFVVQVERSWAPIGADRFYNLVRIGYFNEIRFFRVISNFMVQWGIHGDPQVSRAWKDATIEDEAVRQSNDFGTISFAKSGLPNSRTTQVFINYSNNQRLDAMGFAPFGKVIEGMGVVTDLYSGYGEGAPAGNGPSQGRLQDEGNAYLKKDFPHMDFIKKTEILN
jgi:peptidyl-prolyl cis-trans isomerase A (cyclophilin A)